MNIFIFYYIWLQKHNMDKPTHTHTSFLFFFFFKSQMWQSNSTLVYTTRLWGKICAVCVCGTHRTLSIRIVIGNIHCEFKNPILVQAVADENHTEPHCERKTKRLINALDFIQTLNIYDLYFSTYSVLICKKAGHRCLEVSALSPAYCKNKTVSI